MTKDLANRYAHPVRMEEPEVVGAFIQQGDAVDFYNMMDEDILVGEPFIVYGKIAMTKKIVLRGNVGTANFGGWYDMLVDPNLANPILYGQKVYYDLGLADTDSPGYVTNVAPTNGYWLGWATTPHGQPGRVLLDGTTGKPICAAVGAQRCAVVFHDQVAVFGTHFFGTVPDHTNGDTVLSS